MFAVSASHTNAGIAAKMRAMKQEAARQRERNVSAIERYTQVPVCEVIVPRANSAKAIASRIAAKHGLTFEYLAGASRMKAIVAARFEAIRAVADARPDMSLPAIGRVFNRDHTTIIHALRKTRAEGQIR